MYEITFSYPVDSLPSDAEYSGRNELLNTPLRDIASKAIIIKADDLSGQISDKWRRYFQLIEEYKIYHSAGVICQTLGPISNLGADYLDARHNGGCELWLHGWDHYLSDPIFEFQGTSYQEQYDHLRQSIDMVEDKLSFTMHTFGAPGNRFDVNTALALAAVPEIKVWLGGSEGTDLLNIPIASVAENPSGNMLTVDQVLSRFDNHLERDAILIQIHPNAWDDDEFGHFTDVLDTLVQLDQRVFMMPYQYFKRVADRDVISVFKVDSTTYRLDLTRATYAHRIAFDVPYSVPTP
jgi:hypothetical protein